MKARIADHIRIARARIESAQKHEPLPEFGTEPHYTPEEVAKLWKLAPNTVRSMFVDRTGVLKIGTAGGEKGRRYIKMRIPKSVVDRVHAEMTR